MYVVNFWLVVKTIIKRMLALEYVKKKTKQAVYNRAIKSRKDEIMKRPRILLLAAS